MLSQSDLELPLPGVETGTKKDGTVSALQSHHSTAPLLCSALTASGATKTLKGAQATYPKFPTYEQVYLSSFRRDLSLTSKTVSAVRVGWCQYTVQLGSGDSSFGMLQRRVCLLY